MSHRPDVPACSFTAVAMLLLTLLGVAGPAGAAQDPPVERGFAADRVFALGDIDAVDLASGNTVLTLPLGLTYSVNGGFSYGFKLIYNSTVWDFKELDPRAVCLDPDTWQYYNCPAVRAIPARHSNAGLGWSLSLGQLIDLTDPERPRLQSYTYVAPDGTQHHFSPCIGCGGEDYGSRYPKDGQRLRFRDLVGGDAEQIAVDHPDGTTSLFECHQGDTHGCDTQNRKWWLKSITDSHGNQVKVTYATWMWVSSVTGLSFQSPKWTITDNAGGQTNARTHVVWFRPNTELSNQTPTAYHVHKVELAAFGASVPTATYTFAYTFPKARRSQNDTDDGEWGSWDFLNDDAPHNAPQDRVPFLASVTQPDGSSFSMPAYYTSNGYPEGYDASGVLRKLVLPTGGAIEWTQMAYEYHAWAPKGGGCVVDYPTERCRYSVSRHWSGIGSKILRGSDDSLLGQWTYATALAHDIVPAGDEGTVKMERRVVVTDPNGNASVHYFRALDSEILTYPDLEIWDYALPFTRRVTDPTSAAGSERYLSSEQFQGGVTFDASGSSQGNRKRSTYVRYVSEDVVTGGVTYRGTNRSLQSERRVYHESQTSHSQTADYWDPDGLGHWRTTTEEAGAFDTIGSSRVTFTGYNPQPLGTDYPVYALGSDQTGKVRWGLDQPWVIGTFDRQDVTLGGQTARREVCVERNASGFPTSSFVTRTRTLRTGTSRDQYDLIWRFTKGTGGNVTSEAQFGGDTQPLETNAPVCTVTLPATPKYQIDHTYSFGVLATSRPTGQSAYLVDREIDQATGLVKTSHASSTFVGSTYDGGIVTTLAYDTMGRLTQEAPAAGHDACVLHQYLRYNRPGAPTGDTYARVESCTFPNQACAAECSDASAITSSAVRFDGLGRPVIEKTRLPDVAAACPTPPCWQWNQRLTETNALGWKTAVSEWQPDGTTGSAVKRTLFAYDPFGRVTSVTPPDGSSHAVTTTYDGVRGVTRTFNVFTGTAETAASTSEVYDRLGDLRSVTEASNAGAAFTTSYEYDMADRLTTVKSTLGSAVQTRTFAYDKRGFLTAETLPEKGATGGSTVSYTSYDAGGHLLKKNDGGVTTYAYDGAGRLTAVCEGDVSPCDGSSATLLKAMTYAATNQVIPNQPTNWRAGKLETARAVNPSFTVTGGAIAGKTEVTETYAYAGRGGRVSAKTTAAVLTGATSGNFSQTFTQSFGWNDHGQLDTLVYPTCTPATACTNAMRRSVYHAYQGGRLVAVRPYYASEITYHANGMLKQVTHTRRDVETAVGVAERQEADPSAMGRPYRIFTDGATVPGAAAGGEGDWSNGYYAYDGAGNIKNLLKVSGGVTDPLKPGPDTFTYDPVSRLTAATIATGSSTSLTQAYGYDAWGNLTSYAGQPRTVDPDHPTSNHLDDASYDAAGNQTGWLWNASAGRYTYLYDHDRLNRMRALNGPSLNRVFAYTADGERLVERDLTSGVTTFSLRGLDGKVLREITLQAGASTWLKDYVYRDGQLLASQGDSEALRHYHLDHLGTPRMLTNRCGERVKRYDYFPFGQAVNELLQDPEKMRFTGHQRDLGQASTMQDDLDYMHARYYGTMMGRFMAVDQGNGNPNSPQSCNKYAYALGNPQRYIDPDGRWALPWEALDAYSYNESRKAWAAAADRFTQDPSWGTGLDAAAKFLGNALDSASLMLPVVPAVYGLTVRAEQAFVTIYRSVDKAGDVQYVGFTNDLARRAAEHLATKGIAIEPIKGLERITSGDKRAVEQALMEMHKLGKDGGSLIWNKINSIAKKNPKFAEELERGMKLLRQVGYPGVAP